MIGLCVDSSAQLPPLLVERYGLEVVPHTICIGDREYLEGVDLDVDEFYGYFDQGQHPAVSTAQPNPGQFALAYEQLAERGATEIVSIHACASHSSTVNNARMGARHSMVPVRFVEVAVPGFGVGCCAWAAAEALASGATSDDVARIAEQTAAGVGNVFVTASEADDCIPVLTTVGDHVEVLGKVTSMTAAVDMMAAHIVAWRCPPTGTPLKVAIGRAGSAGAPFGQALEKRLADATDISELIEYRVGPSVGVLSGPATAGAFFFRSQ